MLPCPQPQPQPEQARHPVTGRPHGYGEWLDDSYRHPNPGLAWPGLAWLAWPGLAWPGWPGLTRRVPARLLGGWQARGALLSREFGSPRLRQRAGD